MDKIVVRGGLQILGSAVDGTGDAHLTKDATTGEVGSVTAPGDGADGNTILSGTAAPTTEGVDGDYYIRTSTLFIYGPKASGTWPAGVSIVGATGANGSAGATGATGASGNTLLSGVIAPINGQGANGDFYIDTVTYMIYGPKAGGIWPSGISLVGTTGATGGDGSDGADGADGIDAYIYYAYADDTSGTNYILVASNDATASLTTFNAEKEYIATHISTTAIGSSITSATFAGKWARYIGAGDRWSTNSVTELTIGTGVQTLQVGMNLSYVTGQRTVIAVNGQPGYMMEGYCVSYNPTTGQLVVDVDTTVGAGTFAVWDCSLQASLPDATEFPFSNADVDIGTENVDTISTSLCRRVEWEYMIEKSTNARGGVVTAVVNGTTVSYSEIMTVDIGTVDIDFTVDVSAGDLRLRATATSDNWIIRGLRRIISI